MSVIYMIDSLSILDGPVELPVIPGLGVQMPSNAIELKAILPEPAPNHLWVLADGTPEQRADHRGTVYRTDTGAAQQHEALGELPDGLTNLPRPDPDHAWTGSAWAFDAKLHARNQQALATELCQRIDLAADAARRTVAGDPLRAVEYQQATEQARQFAEAGYPTDAVPRTVSAWAINGRSVRQAADSILAESAAFSEALYAIREARLQAKERVRAAMTAGQVEQAESIATEAVAAIQATETGLGGIPRG